MIRPRRPPAIRCAIIKARAPATAGVGPWAVRTAVCGGVIAALSMGASAAAAEHVSAVQTAVARSEIQALQARALMEFDNKNFERFAGLFAPGGRFTVDDSSSRMAVLPSDMAAAFAAREAANAPGAVRHILGGLYITLTDEIHAKLRGYYMGVARSPSASPAPVDLGAFDSRLVKVQGNWMFEDYHVIHTGPVPLD